MEVFSKRLYEIVYMYVLLFHRYILILFIPE